jgi:hypothetical protein
MKETTQKLGILTGILALSLTSGNAQNTGPNLSGTAGNLSGNFATGTPIGSGNPTPFSSTAVGYANYQAWQTTMASAFTAGNGAVWDSSFSGGQADSVNAGYTALWNNVVLNYAPNKALTLSLESDSATGGNNLFQSSLYGSATATSGHLAIGPNDGGTFATTGYTFDFGLSGSGLAAGESINSLAFALLGRSGAVGTVTFTATFSDATTQTLSIGSALGTQGVNSFFEFNAPTGDSIESLTYASTTGRINPLDDLSFTTTSDVPEPTTIALAGIGLGLLLVSKARRRSF